MHNGHKDRRYHTLVTWRMKISHDERVLQTKGKQKYTTVSLTYTNYSIYVAVVHSYIN